MAAVCRLISCSIDLNVPSAGLGEKKRGMPAVTRFTGFSSEVVGAQKIVQAVDCQGPSLMRFRERKRTVCAMAVQQAPSEPSSSSPEYTPGPLDDFLFKLFRKYMVEEVGWDSEKPGYDGLIEVVKHRYSRSHSKEATEASTVRVLRALFPAWLLPLFRQLIAPLANGKVAAVMTAFVTQATCQWLMGPCTVNEVTLADGSTLLSGVHVHKCKYLEESKCAGICTHTCKVPTQTFIQEFMAIPLAMEPNFSDFSCQGRGPRPSDTMFINMPNRCCQICTEEFCSDRAVSPGVKVGSPNCMYACHAEVWSCGSQVPPNSLTRVRYFFGTGK